MKQFSQNYKESRSELAKKLFSTQDKDERKRILQEEKNKSSYWIDYFSKRTNKQLDLISLVETLGLKELGNKTFIDIPDFAKKLQSYEKDLNSNIQYLKFSLDENNNLISFYRNQILSSYIIYNVEFMRLIESYNQTKAQRIKLQALSVICKDLIEEYNKNNTSINYLEILKILNSSNLRKNINIPSSSFSQEKSGLQLILEMSLRDLTNIKTFESKMLPVFLSNLSQLNKKAIETGCIPEVNKNDSILTRPEFELNENQICLFHMTSPESLEFIDRFGLVGAVKHSAVKDSQFKVKKLSENLNIDRRDCVFASLEIEQIELDKENKSILELRVDIDSCYVGDHELATQALILNHQISALQRGYFSGFESIDELRENAKTAIDRYNKNVVSLRYFLDYVDKHGSYPKEITIPEILISHDVAQKDIRVRTLNYKSD